MEIRLDRPVLADRDEIHIVFKKAIEKVFIDNGISNDADQAFEIESQMKALDSDFNSEGKVNFFLLAKIDGVIVGTAACGRVNDDIKNTIDVAQDAIEIKSIYVHPDYQKQGVGHLLFNSIVAHIANGESEYFYLDCGYSSSQKYWEKMLGDASHQVSNKWGSGAHYKIWKVELEESCLLKK